MTENCNRLKTSKIWVLLAIGKWWKGRQATWQQKARKRATFCNALNLGHILAAAVAWQRRFSFRTMQCSVALLRMFRSTLFVDCLQTKPGCQSDTARLPKTITQLVWQACKSRTQYEVLNATPVQDSSVWANYVCMVFFERIYVELSTAKVYRQATWQQKER